MATVHNLDDGAAIEKLKELANDIIICMFCTNVKDLPFDARPMATKQVDDEGNFWFFSTIISNKNDELANDNNVQLLYAKTANNHYLSVYGHAEIIDDKNKIKRLWNEDDRAWFAEGINDPNLSLIRVVTAEAHYWDTEDNKMIRVLKRAAGAVSGKGVNGRIEGNIKI